MKSKENNVLKFTPNKNKAKYKIKTDFIKKVMLSNYLMLQFKNINIVEDNFENGKGEILFITKFPPTIGGVASQEYWRARKLAEYGFNVRVVTNSNETESQNRSQLTYDELKLLNMDFNHTGGKLRTYFVNPTYKNDEALGHHKHIPMSNMGQSKLIGLALEVIDNYKSKIIMSGYLEPYGSAAAQVHRITKVPLYIGFAGSDINRLSKISDIQYNYKYILSEASIVVSSWEKIGMLIANGANFNNIKPIPAPIIIDDRMFNKYIISQKDNNKIRFGVYGKYSETKRIIEICKAIKQLQPYSKNIELECILGGNIDKRLINYIYDNELYNQVKLRTAMSIWKIPEFINSCNAIFFLESDHSVDIHAPISPIETSMCGVCPILSGEIKEKLRACEFIDRKNSIIVNNPKEVNQITKVLKEILDNPTIIEECGRNARQCVYDSNNFINDFNQYVKIIKDTMNLKRGSNRNNNQLKSLSEIYLTIYTFYPLTIQVLYKYYNREFKQVIESINRDALYFEVLEVFNNYLETRLFKVIKNNIIFKDIVLFEIARVKAILFHKSSKLIHRDLTRVDNIVNLDGVDEKIIPILNSEVTYCELDTNIDYLYKRIYKDELELNKVLRHKVAVLSSQNMQPLTIKVDKNLEYLLDKIKQKKNLSEILSYNRQAMLRLMNDMIKDGLIIYYYE